MTEAEQALVALILLEAERALDKKYRGPIGSLRNATEGRYRLGKFTSAFDNALDHLINKGFATLHRYSGIDDYVSIDLSGTAKSMMKSQLPEFQKSKDFSFAKISPRYPIIASYLDVGPPWLHDFANALAREEFSAKNSIDSASWTGKYVVDPDNKAEIYSAIIKMRVEIEALNLPNSEKSNALSAVKAIEALMDAADPPWALIMTILSSPILANVSAIAALIITMVKS